MAVSFHLYTIGAGDILYSTLNAVASICKNKVFMSILQLCSVIGVAWIAKLLATGTTTGTKAAQDIVKVAIILGVFITPKAQVLIHDRVHSGTLIEKHVDNVPLGLAFLSSLSTIGDALTNMFEVSYQVLDGNSQYSKYGMVFGNKLMDATIHTNIQDPHFVHDVQEYFKECVIPDINLKRLSLKTVVESKDLWRLVSGQGNYTPNQSFYVHLYKNYSEGSADDSKKPVGGKLVKCDTAGGLLDKYWQTEKEDARNRIKSLLFPSTTKEQDALLDDTFNTAVASAVGGKGILSKISKSASSILSQSLAINAFNASMARLGSQGMSQENIYMQLRSQMQIRKSYEITKSQAEHWVPKLRIVLECLLYGFFPFMAIIMMLPFGAKAALSFFTAFLWIQIWSPMHAIVNFIIEGEALKVMTAASKLPDGGNALTIMNHHKIAEASADIALMAGSLMYLIPFLSLGLLTGALYSFNSLATSMSAMPQQAAMTAANEAVTGNMGFGNMNFNNHNFDNTSANKHNTSSFIDEGRIQSIMGSGGMHTSTANGSQIWDQSGANSRLPLSASQVASTTASFNESARDSKELSNRLQESSEGHISASMGSLRQYMHNEGIDSRSSESYSKGEGTDVNKAWGTVLGQAEDISKKHGVEKQAVLDGMFSASVGGGAGKKGIGGSVSTNFGGKAISSEALDATQKASQSEDFKEAISTISKHSKDEQLQNSSHKSDGLIDNFSSNYEQGMSERKSATEAYQQAKSYEIAAHMTKSIGENLSIDETQQLVNFINDDSTIVRNKHGTILNPNETINTPEALKSIYSRYMHTKAKNHIAQDVQSHIRAKGSEINNDNYQARAERLSENHPSVSKFNAGNKAQLESQYALAQEGNIIDKSHLKSDVLSELNDNTNTMNAKQQGLARGFEDKKGNAQDVVDRGAIGAVTDTIGFTDPKNKDAWGNQDNKKSSN